MKRRIYSILFLAVSFIIGHALHSNPTGAPFDASGGPSASGRTCSQSGCHSGTATFVAGVITSNVPAEGYTPGTNYTITVSFSGSGKKGFELSSEDSSGLQRGTFTAGSGSKLLSSNLITHTTYKSTTAATWTLTWTAPAAGTGYTNIYGAFARTTSVTTKQVLVLKEKVIVTPVATTTAATSIDSLNATLTGTGNAKGLTNIGAYFQYGVTANYGTTIAANPQWLADTITTPLTASVTNLTPNTSYHYRLVLINGTDTIKGNDMTFTTLAKKPVSGIEMITPNSLIVYPNPTSDEIHLQGIEPILSNQIHLYSMDGKQAFVLMIESNTIHLPAELKNGIYIIQLDTKQGTITKRIFIQRNY